jgi:hypothetical protein
MYSIQYSSVKCVLDYRRGAVSVLVEVVIR